MATFALESFSFNAGGAGGEIYLHCRVNFLIYIIKYVILSIIIHTINNTLMIRC